ncbi:MAG: hypothetical protein V8T00_05170 [Oscillospiraceae bacterium]
MKDNYNRKIMVSIKLTEQENTYLREKAQEAGCNLSEYCREKLLQDDTTLPKKQAQNFYRQLCIHNAILKDLRLSAEQKAALEEWEVETWQHLK